MICQNLSGLPPLQTTFLGNHISVNQLIDQVIYYKDATKYCMFSNVETNIFLSFKSLLTEYLWVLVVGHNKKNNLKISHWALRVVFHILYHYNLML